VGSALAIVAVFAVTFAVLRWMGASTAAYIGVGCFVAMVGLSQMVLFGGKMPRLASSVTGAAIGLALPVVMLIVEALRPGTVSPNIESDLLEGVIAWPVVGAVLGYSAGCLTASVFLRRDPREDEAPAPTEDADPFADRAAAADPDEADLDPGFEVLPLEDDCPELQGGIAPEEVDDEFEWVELPLLDEHGQVQGQVQGPDEPSEKVDNAVGVPRRFGVSTALVLTTLYAALFTVLRLANATVGTFIATTVFFTGVGLAQMLLYRGQNPRSASIIAGAILLPVVAVVMVVADVPGSGLREPLGFVVVSIVFFVPFGMILGYAAGCLTASVFLVKDRDWKVAEDDDAEEPDPFAPALQDTLQSDVAESELPVAAKPESVGDGV